MIAFLVCIYCTLVVLVGCLWAKKQIKTGFRIMEAKYSLSVKDISIQTRQDILECLKKIK